MGDQCCLASHFIQKLGLAIRINRANGDPLDTLCQKRLHDTLLVSQALGRKMHFALDTAQLGFSLPNTSRTQIPKRINTVSDIGNFVCGLGSAIRHIRSFAGVAATASGQNHCRGACNYCQFFNHDTQVVLFLKN